MPENIALETRTSALLTLSGALLLLFSATAAAQSSPDDRIPPRPIEPPAAYQEAVETGTRSEDGRPGPAYWQQRASYRIEASLEPSTGRLDGSQTIHYENRSPDTLDLVLLHLDQNVYAEGARRNRRAPITGGMPLRNIRVDGAEARARHPGSSYYQALTLLEVELPRPLPPGDSTRISMDWSFTVPPAPTFRNGNVDGELFGIAQWYPRMAVYDDLYGWDRTPYLGDGEFYLEYGDFDVSITVPTGWVVGATGTLQNPGEVLPEDAAERLRSARDSEEVVQVISGEDARNGETTRQDRGSELTWRFTASDVRDFAFTASADYAWDAGSVEIPGREGDERVLLQALYRPHLTAWSRGIEFLAHSLRTLSDWLAPYPYPQLSIAEGPTGGMEYPMFIFNPSTNAERRLASVTIHEAVHQWIPMMVGSMEAKYVWMDEGMASYWEALSTAELFGETPPRWGRTASYLRLAGAEAEVPIMRHTDLVNPHGARGLAAYTKPAVVLGALRAVVGDEAFEAAFHDFFEEWRYRHPQPWDFFRTVERHHGEDLDWFWRPLLYETDVLDHAVTAVEATDETSRIRLEDRGDVILPSPVRVTLADGTRRNEWIPEHTWLEGDRTHEMNVPGRVVEVRLDPDELFPDVDRSNNTWSADEG